MALPSSSSLAEEERLRSLLLTTAGARYRRSQPVEIAFARSATFAATSRSPSDPVRLPTLAATSHSPSEPPTRRCALRLVSRRLSKVRLVGWFDYVTTGGSRARFCGAAPGAEDRSEDDQWESNSDADGNRFVED